MPTNITKLSNGSVEINNGIPAEVIYIQNGTDLVITPYISRNQDQFINIDFSESKNVIQLKFSDLVNINGVAKPGNFYDTIKALAEQVFNWGGGSGSGATGFQLRGSGMPEGVVTAATGTYYTDTSKTNGAILWFKNTGTGNTGWICVIGNIPDTSMIGRQAWIDAFNKTGELEWVGGSFSRSGNVVFIRAVVNKLVAPEVSVLQLIPNGYKPMTVLQTIGMTSSLQTFRFYWGLPTIPLAVAGPISTSIRCEMTFLTNDPWPTVI